MEIPYNQRKYDWDTKNVNQFFDDLCEHYDTDTFYSLGSFMYTVDKQDNNKYSLWDGQQRTITSYLLLSVMYNVIEEECLHDELEEYLYKKPFKYTKKEKKEYDKNHIRLITIKCVDEIDNYVLTYILNNKWIGIENYLGGENNHGRFYCKKCSKKFKNKKETINHIIDTHIDDEKIKQIYVNCYIENKSETKMIVAHKTLTKLVDERKNESSDFLTGLTRFFLDKVLFDRWKYYDIMVASEKFDQLNNRGKKTGNT